MASCGSSTPKRPRIDEGGTLNHAESHIGKALTSRIRLQYPEYALLWVHIPNGVFLGGSQPQRARQMARLKTEGLVPGWPDYMLMIPRGPYHGLCLELKAEGNRPTPSQLTILDALSDEGYCANWAEGYDAAWAMLENYIGMPRPCR